MRLRPTITKVVALLLALFVVLTPAKTTYAAGENPCSTVLQIISFANPSVGSALCTFQKVAGSFADINIRRTVVNTATSAMIDIPSMIAFGRNYDQTTYCLQKANNINIDVSAVSQLVDTSDDCSDILNSTPVTGINGQPTQNASAGSLLGIAITLNDVAYNVEPPLNLAYYLRHTASRVPILNQTAFAQESDTGVFGLSTVILAWEEIRNISYGILAILMLAIGVMVILRHKINPQTVVTVQTAIPRIIISVILITFSYPIGAFAMRVIRPLSFMALGIFTSKIDVAASTQPIVTLLISPVALLQGGMGSNTAIVAASVFVMAGIFLLFLRVVITVIMSYLKIIFAVLAAPITFAWGAVPGNEDAVSNWFKSLAVNVISVPALHAGLGLALLIAASIVKTITQNPTSVIGDVSGPIASMAGNFYLVFVAPLVILLILFQTGKIPRMLEETILGKKPGSKGK